MPVPDLSTFLATTSANTIVMVNWLYPLAIIIVGLAVAPIGFMILFNGIVRGMKYMSGGTTDTK